MKLKTNILVFVFWLAGAPAAHAQYFDFSFEHITSENGLSNEVVTSIVKDKTGFIWFGTRDGLNRYDGRNIRVFRADKEDSTGLPSSQISFMSLDEEGRIWISTPRGLCLLHPEKSRFIMVPFPGNDRNNNLGVSPVVFSKNGYAWFIYDQHLYKMNCSDFGFTRYQLPSRESYYNISVDKKQRVWVYLRSAIYLFQEASGQFSYYGGLNNQNLSSKEMFGPPVITDSDTLFITSYGGGFYYLDEKTDRFLKWKKASHLLSYAVEDFDENGRRFFWCLGGGGGLMIYDPVADRFFEMQNNPRDRYSHNATECPFIFKEPGSGTVWIATKSGVEKYDPYAFRFKRKFLPPSVAYSSFSLVGEVIKDKTDPSGNTYWLGSWALGLFKWNRQSNEFKKFDMQSGLLHHEVFHLLQSGNGYLIIASRDGVQLFDPRTEKPIRQIKNFFQWPVSKKILHVSEDQAGNIWMVANYDGVYQYEIKTGKVKHWELPGIAPERGPYLKGTVQEDRFHRIWVSGLDGKIHILYPGTGEIKTITNENRKGNKLPGDIWKLHINKWSGEIWVSGQGNYLAKLNEEGEVLKLFREKNQENAPGYEIILQDPQGYIWASTGTFIQRIDTSTGERDHFGKEDGLITNSNIYGATITDDGELFLGFQYGFSHINTNQIRLNIHPPRVAVSSVKINYSLRYLDDNGGITLLPGDRVLTLEFAALNFSQPKYNQYAYKLDGYDQDWVYGNDHDITLMNLGGGTHLLHVKASNNDGIWGEEITVPIRVVPPYYNTVWFRSLIALGIGVLIYLAWRFWKAQRRKMDRIRTRIANDLHDDMGSTLSSIRIFSDVAKKQIENDKPETIQLLDRIGHNATALSENMQDIIWTIRSDADTLEDLVARMREFGLRVCDARQIKFNAQVSQNFKTSKLDLEQRRNLYLIFKETINNAVKYSGCTRIDLFLTQQGKYLKMEIADNGKGFTMDKIKRGNGLNNLENRAREIKGELKILSQPGQGTRIHLLMVVKKGLIPDNKL